MLSFTTGEHVRNKLVELYAEIRICIVLVVIGLFKGHQNSLAYYSKLVVTTLIINLAYFPYIPVNTKPFLYIF